MFKKILKQIMNRNNKIYQKKITNHNKQINSKNNLNKK